MFSTPTFSTNTDRAWMDAEQNVIIGEGNILFNLKEADWYKDIVVAIDDLNKRLEQAQTKYDKYPDDEDLSSEIQEIEWERSQKEIAFCLAGKGIRKTNLSKFCIFRNFYFH